MMGNGLEQVGCRLGGPLEAVKPLALASKAQRTPLSKGSSIGEQML